MSKASKQDQALLELETLLRIIAVMASGERVCVHCGCSDSNPCPEGCGWALLHKTTPTGVCTECVEAEEQLVERMLLKRKTGPGRAGRD